MPARNRFRTIDGDELYRRLALGDSLILIDVRTETEYGLRHIPGSLLFPLQSLDSRIDELPHGGVPIAVVCEEGRRSVSACKLLAEHGFDPLFALAGGLGRWPGPLTGGPEPNGRHTLGLAPASFLVDNYRHLKQGLVLDLAMGEGRNAIYLATRGFDVDGVDSHPQAVESARVAARKLGAPIRAIVGNIEDGTFVIPFQTYDDIIVFQYLHRPLFPDIRDGVVPGGVVLYQTYTVEQARYGRPKNPEHLLEPDELRGYFSDWEVLKYREIVGPSRQGGPIRAIASIVARKPA